MQTLHKQQAHCPLGRPQRQPLVARPHVRTRAVSGTTSEQQAPAQAASETGNTKCPFLASLPPPPTAAVPWYKRVSQLWNPRQFQEDIFSSTDAKIVTTPSQLGIPSAIVPGSAEMVKSIFMKEGELSKTYPVLNSGDLVSKEGILFMPPEEHRHMRGLLAPAFTQEAMYQLTPDVLAITRKIFEKWASAEGAVLAYDGIKRLTFEVIMGIMLGKSYPEPEIDRLHKLYTDFSAGFGDWPFIDMPFTRYGRAMAARRTLLEYFREEVKSARAKVEAGEDLPGLHGTMMKATDLSGDRLSESFLAENLLGFLFAGHDTTSTTLTNLMWSLHEHPEVVEKVREEQAALTKQHSAGVSPQLLKGMKYGEAVIKEQMRYQPIATALVRAAAQDFEMGGYRVEKGSVIYMPLAHISTMDPRWVKETGDLAPSRFNPERWLLPQAAGGPSNDYQMPFGYGPRFCLGANLAYLEAKTFLAVLGQGYSFKLTAPDTTKWVLRVGMVPTNGLPMTVSRLSA